MEKRDARRVISGGSLGIGFAAAKLVGARGGGAVVEARDEAKLDAV
jgi:short-subunit dehydrogenase